MLLSRFLLLLCSCMLLAVLVVLLFLLSIRQSGVRQCRVLGMLRSLPGCIFRTLFFRHSVHSILRSLLH